MARLVEKSQEPAAPKTAAAPTICSIDVFWDTPFDADVWKSIVARTKGTRSYERHVEEKGGAHIWARLGVVLPLGGQGLIADLVCVHDEKSDREPLHWGLALRPKPRATPVPKRVKAEDKRWGGKKGLAKFVNSTFGEATAPVGKYEIRFSVPETPEWKCKLVPRDLSPSDPAVSEIGRTAKLEEIGYRFTDGILGIVELSVIYMHDAHRWSVSVQASGPMKVDDILELPLAKEVIDFVTARIFDRLGAS